MEEQINSQNPEKIYIYESPDKGKTIYQREFQAPHNTRELIVKNN